MPLTSRYATAEGPTVSSEPHVVSPESSNLLELFDISLLWKRKWSLVFSVLAAAGLGAAYVQQQAPIYEVTARVLVQLQRLAPEQDGLVRTDSSFRDTQAEILRSPAVAQRALEEVKESPPEFEEAAKVLKTLRVSSVEDANVLKLTYRSDNAEGAAKLLHAIVDKYREYTKEMQHGGFGDALKVLTQRDTDLRDELEQLEAKYFLLRRDSPLIGQGREALGAHITMVEQLGRRLTEARSKRIDKETQWQALLLARGIEQPLNPRDKQLDPIAFRTEDEETPLSDTFVTLKASDVVDGNRTAEIFADLTRLHEELWRAELKAKETGQIYGPLHPEASAVEAQIMLCRERLKAYEKAAPELLTQELNVLRKNELHLTSLYEAEFQKVKELDTSVLKEQQALAEISRVQDIHEVTARQLRELKLADEAFAHGQITTMVRMLEAPNATTAKLVWPRKPEFISLCAAFGLVAGFVLITLAERVTRH